MYTYMLFFKLNANYSSAVKLHKGVISKLKYLAESCTKRTPPRNVMCLIGPSCVVDLGCIFNVILQFVKHSSCDLVVRQ